MYNILWIDDKHEGMLGFKGHAKSEDILLKCFKSLNSGLEEIEKKYAEYDGILLDAKFLESDDDVSGTEDTKYVHRAKERIWNLPKKFEVFVLTGQAEAFESEEFKNAFPNVYIKGSEVETERLFKDLKIAADRQKDTQLRQHYPQVFKICNEHLLGEKHSETLLEVVKSLEDNSISGASEDFTALRKILETLFKRLSDLEILPKNFVDEKGWINGSAKFISNRLEGYSQNEDNFFHPTIKETLFRVMNIVQDGSHNEGNLRLQCDDFCKTQKTGYLYKSTVYAVLDILAYFRKLMDENQNPEENRKRWKKLESEIISGLVEQDENNNYFISNYIFHYLTAVKTLKRGDKVEISSFNDNNNASTKTKYPYFITKFKKIES